MAQNATKTTTSKAAVRLLYRSLLRSSRSFSNPAPRGRVLSSLLHRTGYDYHDYYDELRASLLKSSSSSSSSSRGPLPPHQPSGTARSSSHRDVRLSSDQARDLTRGYRELQKREHRKLSRRGGSGGARAVVYSDSSDSEEVEVENDDEDEDEDEDAVELPPAHEVLFRLLLKEALGGGETLMRFPCQVDVSCDGGGPWASSLNKRWSLSSASTSVVSAAPTVEDIVRREFRSSGGDNRSASGTFDHPSRIRAAFLALRELNKKLAFAKSRGLSLDEERARVRTSSSQNDSTDSTAIDAATDTCGDIGSDANRLRNRRQAARDVRPLPLGGGASSSYLRGGTYLVAHPLVDGFFSRSVISIIEHTNPVESSSRGGGSGGTYGLVVNKPVVFSEENKQKSRGGDSSLGLAATMDEVIKTIPPGLRRAFGDCRVRTGGPVGSSVQMMHRCSPELEERMNLGGNVLSSAAVDDTIFENDASDGIVGGQDGECSTTALESDNAVYFRGDIIRAAQAVMEGEMQKSDFAFLVGASTWSEGQLEAEIERGWWLPCSGPPGIAFTGRCEHQFEEVLGAGEGEEGLSSPRNFEPRDNLWLSMMCALGEGEGDLAHLMLDDEAGGDSNAEPCDDF